MYEFEKFRMTYHEQMKQFPLMFLGQLMGPEIFGWGAIKMTGGVCQNAGMKHALIVTTGLRGTGIVDEIEGIVKYAGVATSVFKVGQTNPRIDDAEKGLQAFKDSGADGLLSIGGGSSHDTAKLIRLRLANPDKTIREMAAQLDPHFTTVIPFLKPITVPQVAVNTTAGTGAEMTGVAAVTDWEEHWKFPLITMGMAPSMGIMDPACLRTLPERLAAQTGIDAFVHAIDGFIGRLECELAKATGKAGAKKVWENLPEFTYNRWNEKACEGMAWAQYLGASTYALGGGGALTHSIGHQVSALNNMHHGLGNAIALIPVLAWNLPAKPAGYAELARDVFEVDIRNMNRIDAANAFLEKVDELLSLVGIAPDQRKLSNYGITLEDCKKMIKHSINDVNYEANPRETTEEQVLEIYKSLL
jgi:alcohol dehydrogenase class IV